MISILTGITSLMLLFYYSKKKKYILCSILIFILSFVVFFNIFIRGNTIDLYIETPSNFQYTIAKDIRLTNNHMLESIKLANGEYFKPLNTLNRYIIKEQYHSTDYEVDMYTINYKLNNKFLHYLTGLPLTQTGHFLEIGAPAKK